MTSDTITIPPEALEAFLNQCEKVGVRFPTKGSALKACLAMLKNWPGMVVSPEIYNQHNEVTAPPAIILPLAQEPSDDK
jgi:hypothetical protein